MGRLAGITLDDWQFDGLYDAMGIRPDGKHAAPQVGWIVPRQNGKNYGVMVAQLYWLFLCPEDREITHSAHVFRTVKGHFREMRERIEGTPELRRKIMRNGFRVSNEDLSITTTDGSKLTFMTRTKGSGRGLHGDKVVLDEAMWLWDDSLEAVLPIQSARKNPQTWFTSSSPTPGEQSDVLRRFCKRGRAGSPNLAYMEFSAPEDADLDDEAVWFAANPSLGRHLSLEAVRLERETLTDDGFARERLGIWTEDAGKEGAIDLTAWAGLQVPTADADWLAGEVCFGIEGPPSGDYVSVVAAGMVGDRVGIELAKREPGTEWLLPWAVEANERRRPKGFVFDPKSATADAHMAAFRAAGLPVIECGFADRALPQATIGINDDIHNDRLRVLSHPLFDAAVEGAERRYLGESWLWNRKAGVDPTPLVAATLARWGLLLPIEAAPEPFFFYAD